MNLYFDSSLKAGYKSSSQLSRRMSEGWIANNMYCPRCGNQSITQFSNNRPVADFFCPLCESQFELKSKSGQITSRIIDGAYVTLIERILSNTNPDFLFMTYQQSALKVENLIIVPKYFIVPDMIEKRKPLSSTAKRAGWMGCNILLSNIPSQGRIPIISHGVLVNKQIVIENVNRSVFLDKIDLSKRGWLLDILNCINSIPDIDFTLEQVYEFEHYLAVKHPENHNIRAKIRQQLQVLRDKGYLVFLNRGEYRKV